jgi:2-polyprenyl-3-methyl-5-hydroxy-6-metoxy-1,4-benzoquinol methylase
MNASPAAVWIPQYQFKPDRYSSHAVIIDRAGNGIGKRLLDVGSAGGYLAEVFRSKGFEVVCLESSPLYAAAAEKKGLHVVRADLDLSLPELPGLFDVVVCGDVLEHLKDPLAVLARLGSRLKQDGRVIVSVPNIAHLWIRLQLALGKFDYADRGILDRTHLRFFTLSSFRQLLRDAELQVMELTSTPVPLPLLVPARWQGFTFNLVHSTNAFLARMWLRGLAYQFVAVTRRTQ